MSVLTGAVLRSMSVPAAAFDRSLIHSGPKPSISPLSVTLDGGTREEVALVSRVLTYQHPNDSVHHKKCMSAQRGSAKVSRWNRQKRQREQAGLKAGVKRKSAEVVW
jgi:hypothetical protein